MAAFLAVLLLLLLGGGVALLFYFCGRRSIPDYWDESNLLSRGYGQRRGDVLPGKAVLEPRLEKVEVTADDERMLRGVLLPRKKPKGTVILFHDRLGSWKLDCTGMAAYLYGLGYRVLLPDHRAHGESGGSFSTWGVWERFDVRAWTNYAQLRFGEDHPIWLGGIGMGGAAVLMAASLDLPGNVRGIFSAGAYTSPEAMIRWRLSSKTMLPGFLACFLLNIFTSLLAGFGLRDYDALRGLAEAAYPVLLLHGTADRSVPATMAGELYDACKGERRLYLARNADHGLCRVTDPGGVGNALKEFLQKYEKDLADYIES